MIPAFHIFESHRQSWAVFVVVGIVINYFDTFSTHRGCRLVPIDLNQQFGFSASSAGYFGLYGTIKVAIFYVRLERVREAWFMIE